MCGQCQSVISQSLLSRILIYLFAQGHDQTTETTIDQVYRNVIDCAQQPFLNPMVSESICGFLVVCRFLQGVEGLLTPRQFYLVCMSIYSTWLTINLPFRCPCLSYPSLCLILTPTPASLRLVLCHQDDKSLCGPSSPGSVRSLMGSLISSR